MREIRLHDTLDFPAQAVFESAAYDLECLARVMPDVETLVPLVTERPSPRELLRTDRWQGKSRGHALQHLLALNTACWEVDSRWSSETQRVDWSIRVLEPKNAVSAQGYIAMAAAGPEQTHVEMTGELSFHPGTLGRAMALMGAAVSPLVEQTLVAMVERNLAALLGAVEARLLACSGTHTGAHSKCSGRARRHGFGFKPALLGS